MNAQQISNLLIANARFENECWQQAKREISASTSPSGIDFIHRVALRAQQIKMERQHAQTILAFKPNKGEGQ